MVAREAPVKSNKFCLTDVLNMSAQLFSLLLLPLPSLFSQRLNQGHQMQWCSYSTTVPAATPHSSISRAAVMPGRKAQWRMRNSYFISAFSLFCRELISFLLPTPFPGRCGFTCFFLGRWAKEAGWEGSIYSSPPVYVPFLADVIELCTNAGRRENSGRRENWGNWRSLANAWVIQSASKCKE